MPLSESLAEKFEDLVGETLARIDVRRDVNEILLTTENGPVVVLYHEQRLNGLLGAGDAKAIIGKPITKVAWMEKTTVDRAAARFDTKITLHFEGGKFTSRWRGWSDELDSPWVCITNIAIL